MTTVVQDIKGNPLDRRRIKLLLLTRKTDTWFQYDPSKMDEYPYVVSGENINLDQLREISEKGDFTPYAMLKGDTSCMKVLLVEILGESE